jgi:hypothetical protein
VEQELLMFLFLLVVVEVDHMEIRDMKMDLEVVLVNFIQHQLAQDTQLD